MLEYLLAADGRPVSAEELLDARVGRGGKPVHDDGQDDDRAAPGQARRAAGDRDDPRGRVPDLMATISPPLTPARWLRLPRRTARLRLTLLYSGMFLVLGTIVVVLIALLFVGSTSVVATAVRAAPGPGGGQLVLPVGIAQSQHSNDVAKLLAASWVVLALTAARLHGARLVRRRAGAASAAGDHRRRRGRSRPATSTSGSRSPGRSDEFKQLGDTLDDLLAQARVVVRVATAVRRQRVARATDSADRRSGRCCRSRSPTRTPASSRCARRARSCSPPGPSRSGCSSRCSRSRAASAGSTGATRSTSRRSPADAVEAAALGTRAAGDRAPLGAVAGGYRWERCTGRAAGREPRRERDRAQRPGRRLRRGPHRDRGATARCWRSATAGR